ncbi:MAG: mannose-6-phosphate isomerase, class I [Acidimicrobiia bacterium]|nr:mannose-6-phosphate isomerase, class I [Acidimicrobiia bacterium]
MRRISGSLQHYPWGRFTAIAELRHVEPSGRPEAEYWLGTHPRGPSRVILDGGGEGPTLDSVIAAEPERWLGSPVLDRFGELPFLLKILAADRPLSIQAHPTAEQARVGFERENLAGIERDDFKRSYHDPNHKPELICALSPFEAKCGLRVLHETRRLFSTFTPAALDPVRARLDGDGDGDGPSVLGGVVSWMLELDQQRAMELVDAVVSEARRLLDSPDELAPIADFRLDLEWTVRIHDVHPGDIGVVVALLLNHLTLQPGQALFLEAGVLHAYLSGVGIEVMANSDNVLRGGLTTKHVDVDELLSVASFEPCRPQVQTISRPTHRFDAPVPEFALTAYGFAEGAERSICEVEGPEIVLVESGSATLSTAPSTIAPGNGPTVRLSPGQAVAIPAATGRYELALEGDGTRIWRATVG